MFQFDLYTLQQHHTTVSGHLFHTKKKIYRKQSLLTREGLSKLEQLPYQLSSLLKVCWGSWHCEVNYFSSPCVEHYQTHGQVE